LSLHAPPITSQSPGASCRATNCPVAVTIEREFFGQCDVGNTARESIQM
jgi:hypothetical protein